MTDTKILSKIAISILALSLVKGPPATPLHMNHRSRAVALSMELPGLMVAVCLLLLYVLAPAHATKGVDLSTPTSKAAFSCLKGQGYEFVIVRAYLSSGRPDSAATATLASAQDAGIAYTDVYLFPCPKCSKSAAEQVREMGESHMQRRA